MQETYGSSLVKNYLARLLIGLGVSAVLLIGIACLLALVFALPVQDETRLWIAVIGVLAIFGLVIAALVAWGAAVIRRRNALLDEAFAPYSLPGRRYLLTGRQYAGKYRGRDVHVYFYISGGRYLRVPVLQLYVSGRIATRVAFGRRNAISDIARELTHRETLSIDDPAFADLHVFPDDPDWTADLLQDAGVRAQIADLFGEGAPGALRSLMIGPGSVNFVLRHFNPGSLTPESLGTILESLISLAGAAECRPPPSVRVEETDLMRRSRMDRSSFTWIVWVLLGGIVLCAIAAGAVGLALALFLG